MIEQTTIEHHIQKHIFNVLMLQKYARFRDMRPRNIDSNLYSYHLKLMQKAGFIQKSSEGYTLAKKGYQYIDRITTKTLNVRMQPKIITMLLVQNSIGDLLLFKRIRQPYADQWTLPYGKVHVDDESLELAAQREVKEKLHLSPQSVRHAGDCYIRVHQDNEIILSTLAHIFRFEIDVVPHNTRIQWVRPHKLSSYNLAPAVEKIVARSFFNDPFFFEEFSEELVQ